MNSLLSTWGTRAPGIAALLIASVFCLSLGPPAWAAAGCPKCGHSPCICGGGGGAQPGHTGSTRRQGGGMGGGFGLSVDLGGLFQKKPQAQAPGPVEIKDNDREEKKPKQPKAQARQGDDCDELLKKVQAADKKYLDAYEEDEAAGRALKEAEDALEKEGGANVRNVLVHRNECLHSADTMTQDAAKAAAKGDTAEAEKIKDSAKKCNDMAKRDDKILDDLVAKNPKLKPLIAEATKARQRRGRTGKAMFDAKDEFEKIRKQYVKHCGVKYKGAVESKKKAEKKTD